jgi:hypothetical protein
MKLTHALKSRVLALLSNSALLALRIRGRMRREIQDLTAGGVTITLDAEETLILLLLLILLLQTTRKIDPL